MKRQLAVFFVFTVLLLGGLGFVVQATSAAGLTADQVATRKAQLQTQLDQVNKEIAVQQKLLSAKQKETSSIARDVSILTFKISTAKLNIKAKQLEIERLTTTIGKKATMIGQLNVKLTENQESLAEILKKTREIDGKSLIELALGDEQLTSFFADLDYFNFIHSALGKTVVAVKDTRSRTEREKVGLEDQRDGVYDAKKAIEIEKVSIEKNEKEKQRLLSLSKAQEKSYQSVLTEKKQKRDAILSALFRLRDSGSITFGKAYDYAKVVSAKTGIRPAFLLAILTQESNLGKNVGTCNRPGDPASKNWKNIMKPERDIEPFKRITKSLGLDPDTTPLSCPMGNGWGGAMGPAQFIPSTWESFKSRIAKVTGNNPPNPWEAGDAFAASGLYLTDLGAGGGRASG
ncbi:MAG: lytic murein transglycosylase, partial [bacterium]